ncbi:uncharacterized protein LOC126680825 [Mercurialis annua]|uniref:uncharacterized protein LOC126680825 n=1 Tax=Mercurialis annua TaxID=3986 RepID=UPI00215EB989|nr:uncharacterized protein LOC126680825 [Mercurialis annua]
MVHTKKRKRLHPQKMNDLVFVMYNLKLKERLSKKDDITCTIEDVSSDDEWITEISNVNDPLNEAWHGALRGGSANRCHINESNEVAIEDEDLEIQEHGDDIMLHEDSGDEVDKPFEESNGIEVSSPDLNACGSTNVDVYAHELENDAENIVEGEHGANDDDEDESYLNDKTVDDLF